MSKNFLTLSLAVLLVGLQGFAAPHVYAQGGDAKSAAKFRKKVAEIGTGPRAQVLVKLYDGVKVRGHISEIADDHFTVTDKKSGAVQVQYEQVKSLKETYIPKWMKVSGWVALGIMVPLIVSTVVVVAQGGQ